MNSIWGVTSHSIFDSIDCIYIMQVLKLFCLTTQSICCQKSENFFFERQKKIAVLSPIIFFVVLIFWKEKVCAKCKTHRILIAGIRI
jgi:hypothetical protein